MAHELYYGDYLRFYAISTTGSADFIGADNLVGDKFTLRLEDEGASYRAYLVNRFGKEIGYLEPSRVRELQLALAKGWEVSAYLSFIAFTEGKGEDEPGRYWGEMAVLAYDPKLKLVLAPFCKKLAAAMADGGRPQVNFGVQAIERLRASKGTWFPTEKASRPKLGKGSSIIKDHRSPNERLIELARARNKGCYVISWAFIALLVAAFLYLLRSCGVF